MTSKDISREATTQGPGGGGAPSGEGSAAGEAVGPYVLVQLLGEGGFGHVWLAEQREPVRRRVALKLVKPGMDSAEVLARFETERRALAMMDHPHIARVLDAGLTTLGRPYFAMEYVRGEPITEFADKQRLSTRQRLDLFVDVCRAVQHAHQKGIIHRDLKPSNILVTMVDGKPVVKVIDFGIARAMHRPRVEETMHTLAGQMLGTPEYMSPEQAGEVGYEGDIDTRSDVYSLGVVLYLLLTGALPFDSKTLRAAGYEGIRKLLVEVTPPKPSTRLQEAAAGKTVGPVPMEEIARRRNTEARQLSRLVRGDLDWIVMKCLEKDRTRRYESAASVAEDIERHLKSEPVLAGPPSATYRAAKFFHRHRVGAVVGSVFALVVVAGLVGMSLLYSRAERQRAVAVMEEAKARAAVNFVLDMFESIDPAVAQGREVQVRELLDDAQRKAADLKAQPLLEATIRQMLGKAYNRLGKYEAAASNLARASELRARELGAADPATLMSENERGANALSRGEVAEAEKTLRRVHQDRERVLGPEHPDTLFTLSLIAETEKAREDYPAAEKTLRRVIDGQVKAIGAGHRDTIDSRCGLADAYEQDGKFEEAVNEISIAASDARRSLGENDPMTLQALSIKGSILNAMDRTREAVEILREVVTRKSKVLGPDHPQTLISMNALASALDAVKEHAEAELIYGPLVKGAIERLGPEHSTTLSYQNNYAQCLRKQGKYAEAEPLYRAVLAVQRRTTGDRSRSTLTTLNNLGILMIQMKRPAEGLPLLRETLEGLTATLPADHWMIGASKTYVGQCLIELGQFDEAEKLLTDAHTLLAAKMGPKHDRTRQAAQQLSKLYEAKKMPEKSAEWKATSEAK